MNRTRHVLVTLNGFLALTAISGALFAVPTVKAELLKPFPDATIPAVSLGVVGLLALAGAAGVAWKPVLGAPLSAVAGAGLVVFEVVEATVVGNLLAVPASMASGDTWGLWLQPVFMTVGLAMAALGLRLWSEVLPARSWTSRLRRPFAG